MTMSIFGWIKLTLKKIRQPTLTGHRDKSSLGVKSQLTWPAKWARGFPLHHCHPFLFIFTPAESYILSRNLDAFKTNSGPVIF